MNNIDIARWIKNNLSPFIKEAIKTKGTQLYTEAWLAGITMRETGILIARHAPLTKDLHALASVMMGDKSQRPGETTAWYHGFGFTQIDIASFPDFIKSGDWKDPLKVYLKTIDVLEGKRRYIVARFANLQGDNLKRYITAAYNCGEGNEAKVISKHIDVDAYTANHDYSKKVFEFAEIYNNLL